MIATSPSADTVARRLAICLPDLQLDRAARPTEVPFDSLDLVAFLCAIDQEFGVRISTEEFQSAATIDALFEIVAGRSNATN